MSDAFENGWVIDVALALVGLEVVILWMVFRRRAQGLRLPDLLGQTFAGVLLLLAVRCALTDAPWTWVAGFLAASFPAHLWELRRRYVLARDRPPTIAHAVP